MKIALLLLLCACGARTEIAAPEHDASVDVTPPDVVQTRVCPPDCFVGHQCCAGSCGGPAVPMPSDCCACLPGEVSSFTCGSNDMCGH
jgi:hypothetical protein